MRATTSSEGMVPEPPASDRIYPWYCRKNFLLLAVCCAGPLALPLVWARPRTTPFLKTVLTIAIVLGSLIAVVPGILAAIMIPAMERASSDSMVLMVPIFAVLFVLAMIPSIRAQFAYSQTFYVLVDDPGCGALEAIRRSKAMMDGFKWKYFCLGLRFIGWVLLSMLTCGIGLLWVVPYVMASNAHFHDDVRGNA